MVCPLVCARGTHRNQVWQFDFSLFETLGGGTWRLAGCANYFAKHEFGWRISPTENHHDAMAAVTQAIDEVELLLGHSLLRDVTDVDGVVHPVKLVTDNGPAFKAIGFAQFSDSRPELVHIRARRKSPHTNGVRERAFEPRWGMSEQAQTRERGDVRLGLDSSRVRATLDRYLTFMGSEVGDGRVSRRPWTPRWGEDRPMGAGRRRGSRGAGVE